MPPSGPKLRVGEGGGLVVKTIFTHPVISIHIPILPGQGVVSYATACTPVPPQR